MTDSPDNSVHWQFAAFHAFNALEAQVRHFDFAIEVGQASYSGLTPQYFLDVIDGFLSESDQVTPGGTRNKLNELRRLIVHHYLAAFNCGWHTAIESWYRSSKQYDGNSNEEVHEMARKASPFGSTKCEWFVEGFSQSWSKVKMESVRSE